MTETRSERTMRSKRIIAEHGQELVRRYEAGESLPKLAAEFDLHVGTLSTVVKRLGGTVRSHNIGIGEKRRLAVRLGSEMAARYAEGESLKEIALDVGLTQGTVARAVRDSGGTLRPAGSSRRRYGQANSSFGTGSHIKDGYRMVLLTPDHPYVSMSTKRRYIPEHRLVMAEMIKRPLLAEETVHHINGDRLDNRPENLQLRSGRHGKGSHHRCLDCGSQNVSAVEI